LAENCGQFKAEHWAVVHHSKGERIRSPASRGEGEPRSFVS